MKPVKQREGKRTCAALLTNPPHWSPPMMNRLPSSRFSNVGYHRRVGMVDSHQLQDLSSHGLSNRILKGKISTKSRKQEARSYLRFATVNAMIWTACPVLTRSGKTTGRNSYEMSQNTSRQLKIFKRTLISTNVKPGAIPQYSTTSTEGVRHNVHRPNGIRVNIVFRRPSWMHRVSNLRGRRNLKLRGYLAHQVLRTVAGLFSVLSTK